MRVSNQFADVTTGVIYIHSSPAAVCPHVEWALAATLSSRPELTWIGQPADVGVLRTTIDWVGPVGTAGRLAEALRVWPMLRFEITENPSEGVDGERYSYVPRLGLWRGCASANGDVVVGEMRLRAMLASFRRRRRTPPGAGDGLGRRTRAVSQRCRGRRGDVAPARRRLSRPVPTT